MGIFFREYWNTGILEECSSLVTGASGASYTKLYFTDHEEDNHTFHKEN